MGAISQTNTRSLADVEAQMDADGVLFPDAQDALRQEITSVEPLFESDPVLQEHLTRFIGLSGVGSGTYLRESLIECREFFASLEQALVEMLPKGSETIPAAECVAQVASLVDKLHRSELCLVLARNRYMTAELFHKTEAYLNELQQEVRSICNSLIVETLQEWDPSRFVEAVVDLRDLPQRMRLSVALRFQCSDISEIQAGDVFEFREPSAHQALVVIGGESHILLGPLSNGQGDVISTCMGSREYDRWRADLSKVPASHIFVTRGMEILTCNVVRPCSPLQPFRSGVHVMRPGDLYTKRCYEVGEIIGFHRNGQFEGLYDVLWKRPDLSVIITRERVEDLRVYSRGDTATISSSLAAHALTDDPMSPLFAIVVRTELPPSRERAARELTSLCKAILAAEYPIALHVLGAGIRKWSVLEQFSSRVALCSGGGLPTEDAGFLRKHGCTPVVLIVDSEDNHQLTQDIKDLRRMGWEVIICSDRSMTDRYVESAIADLAPLTHEGAITVVDIFESSREQLSAAIEACAKRAKEALDAPIQQRGLHTGISRSALNSLADALDGLAEADPTRTIARRPRELYLVRDAVEAVRRGDTDRALQSIKTCTAQFDGPSRAQHGITETQESWSLRDLVELSAALAKSRLPPSHPAVLLRGVTCLDLSPAALAHLLHQGAQIFRHVDELGVTRSMILSLPPAATDATRPGLSASLDHEGSVGYIYWVWVDPDGAGDVRAAYTKLLNRVVLEQLAEGATFLFGRVLERNAASIRAVRSIGGFEIIETRAVIGGEPAVAVGVDLSRDVVEQTERAPSLGPRAVVEESMRVFASGLHDLSKDEEVLAAQRLRVSVTHEFLIHAYSFKSACEDVLAFVTNDMWWGDGHQMIRLAEDALTRCAPWFTDAQKGDAKRALEMCTDDTACEAGKNALRIILSEVIPESLKSIFATHTRLREKALQFLDMELESISPSRVLQNLRQRKDTLPIPPRVDVEANRKAFKQLPEREQRILDSWWDRSYQQFCWVRDSHPDVYGCHRTWRKWIERDIEETGAFCYPPGIPESKDRETSEATRKHFEEFAQIIEWANEVARAGHFDQHVAAFLYPIIHAFLGRKP